MTIPIYKAWQERIDSGVFTKAQCSAFTRSVATQAMGYGPTGHKSAITEAMAEVLLERLQQRGGVRLTEEHTEQGLRWLRLYGKNFGPDFPLDRILADFDHFSFDGDFTTAGVGWRGPDGRERVGTIIVWHVHLKGGTVIDYWYAGWRSYNTSGWTYGRSNAVNA